MVVDVCQMYSPKFPNNILDMESQMNGIAVIRPSRVIDAVRRRCCIKVETRVRLLVCKPARKLLMRYKDTESVSIAIK